MSARVFRFGVFEVDAVTGELRKQGLRIRLQEQPSQLLLMLLERAGEVVGREEICRKLWAPDTFVDFDQSLGTALRKLRQALNDDADTPHYIETVPKHGFRFVAPVERISATNPPHAPEAGTSNTAVSRFLRTVSDLPLWPSVRRGMTNSGSAHYLNRMHNRSMGRKARCCHSGRPIAAELVSSRQAS